MDLLSYRLGTMQVNCYLIINNRDCIIIDPGDDASFLLEEIVRRRLSLQGILATHGHFDHVMAVGEIQSALGTPLYISEKDDFLLSRMGETARYFLGFEPYTMPVIDKYWLQSTILTLPSISCKVIATPGHTPGSVCFYFEKEQWLFCGDTVFKDGVGRTDFSYSNKNNLEQLIRNLLCLDDSMSVYPGHGDKTTIGELRTLYT